MGQSTEKVIETTASCVLMSEARYDKLVGLIGWHKKLNIILIFGGIAYVLLKRSNTIKVLKEKNARLQDENKALRGVKTK